MQTPLHAPLRALLQRVSALLHLDATYIIKGSFWLTIGQIAATGTSFFIAIVFANFVSPAVYGNYKYVLSIVSVLTVFTLPGINYALAAAVAGGAEGGYIKAVHKKIRWGLLGSVASIAVAAYFYFSSHNTELAAALIITACFLPFMDSIGLYNTFLQSKKLFRESIAYFSASQLLATMCVIGAIIATKNLVAIVLVYFVAWTGVRLWCFLRTRRRFPPNAVIDAKTESYGAHATVAIIFSNITSYLDTLLLFHTVGPIQVAIYNIAVAPPEQIKGLSKNIPALSLPKLAARSVSEIKQMLGRRLFMLSLIGLVSSIAYYFIAPILFSIFFRQYPESVFLSQLFAFSLALRLPLSLFTTVIQSKLTAQSKQAIYLGIIPHIILILALVILTTQFGIIGTIGARYVYFVAALLITVLQWRLLLARDAAGA